MEEETGVTPEQTAEEVETVATEETEVVEELAHDAGAEPEETEKKSKGVQKRIDELVKQREDERRRAERLETMLEQMLLKQQTKEEAPKPVEFQATRPKPTLESCEFDTEKYADELTDWKLEQREAKARLTQQQAQQEQQKQAETQTFQEKRDATLAEGRKKFPDFEELVYALPGNVMHQALAAAVFETAAPADVAYYLGKNPEEAARIAALPPVKMALELGRLESKAVIPPAKPKPSAAPPPVTPVGQNAAAGAEPDPAKNPEAWIAWERERCRKAGRRY